MLSERFLDSGAGGDRLYGRAGDDQLYSLLGQGLVGSSGNFDEQVKAREIGLAEFRNGPELLDGGEGTDFALVDRSDSPRSFNLDLGDPSLASALGDGTTIVRVERIECHAGSGNDNLIGGALDDALYGGAGRDFLSGGGGQDTITGTSVDDLLYWLAGNDVIHGGKGNDVLYGGAGSAPEFGDDGNDSFFRGEGERGYRPRLCALRHGQLRCDSASRWVGQTPGRRLATPTSRSRGLSAQDPTMPWSATARVTTSGDSRATTSSTASAAATRCTAAPATTSSTSPVRAGWSERLRCGLREGARHDRAVLRAQRPPQHLLRCVP